MNQLSDKPHKPLQLFLRLIAYTKPYLGKFLLAMLFLFISGGLGLVYPVFFGKIIDAAFTDSKLADLNVNALLLVLVFAVQAVFIYFRYYLVAWVAERVVLNIRVQLYSHINTLSQSFFKNSSTGEIISRLSDDVNRIQGAVGLDLSTFLRCSIALIGVSVILLSTNPKLTGLIFLVVPPLAIMATLWGRSIVALSKNAQYHLAKATGCAEEGIVAIETVQAYTHEKYEIRKYRESIENAFVHLIRQVKGRALFFSMAMFMVFSSITGVFWFGGRMVATGEISPGELTQFMLYTVILAESVGSFAALWGNLSAALGSTIRIFDILDEPASIIDSPDATDFVGKLGRVEFENVSFAYPEHSKKILDNISFDVEPGNICAIVGPSGSGKTTVGRLLLRFYDSQQGQITIDKKHISSITLASLRGKMSIVAQDAPLFSGTVIDNILYGRLDATSTDAISAAKLANADTFISAMKDGYNTVVGERGVKLSGGQRQRIAIARAILRNPDILILDEATSALDSENEGIVQEALDRVQKGRTTIVIAHRLCTVRNADKILVLEDGKLVETGNHDSLMETGGIYAAMVARQA